MTARQIKVLEAKVAAANKATEKERKRRLEANKALEKAKKRRLDAERKAKKRRLDAERKVREVNGSVRNPRTKREWLGQAMPLPTFIIGSSRPSGKDRHETYAPGSVKQWDNFVKEAMDYQQNKRIKGVPSPTYVLDVLREKEVQSNADAVDAMGYVLDYICKSPYNWKTRHGEKCSVSETVKGNSRRNSTTPCPRAGDTAAIALSQSFEPDLAVTKNGKYVLSVEMKAMISFHGMDTGGISLVDSYNDPSGAQSRHHRAIVHQLVAYMVNLGIGYGMISTVEFSYFVRIFDHQLEISEAVKFNSRYPTLLEALFYVLNKSTNELTRHSPPTYSIDRTRNSNEHAEDSSPEQKKKRRSTKIIKTGTRKSPRELTRASGYYDEFRETAAINLQLDAKPYSAGGWSGKVGLGVINGQQVAIKIAPVNTEKAEALLKEVTAYNMLRRHWGRFVPPLVNHGTTVNGTLFFVAIKFFHGSDMSKRTPSQAEWRAAEEALNAIHSCGLLHGDIHEGNIMVEEGGGVQFIDFGFSKLITNKAECSEEINQLKTLSRRKTISQDACDSSVTQA